MQSDAVGTVLQQSVDWTLLKWPELVLDPGCMEMPQKRKLKSLAKIYIYICVYICVYIYIYMCIYIVNSAARSHVHDEINLSIRCSPRGGSTPFWGVEGLWACAIALSVTLSWKVPSGSIDRAGHGGKQKRSCVPSRARRDSGWSYLCRIDIGSGAATINRVQLRNSLSAWPQQMRDRAKEEVFPIS